MNLPLKPIPNAISPEYADHLVEELQSLERPDLTQIRRSLNKLETIELLAIRTNLNLISNAIHNITYERKPTKTRQARDHKVKRIAKLKELGELD